MTWWRCGCSGPAHFAMQWSVTKRSPCVRGEHTAPQVNYARTYKRESTTLIYQRHFLLRIFKFPFFTLLMLHRTKPALKYAYNTHVRSISIQKSVWKARQNEIRHKWQCISFRITRSRYAFVKHTKQTIGAIIQPIYFSFYVSVYWSHSTHQPIYLYHFGAIPKFPKASSYLSVRPTTRPPAWNDSVSNERIFMKFDTGVLL
jgi:hypothetical protein